MLVVCLCSHKGFVSYADFKRGLTTALDLDFSDTSLDKLVQRCDSRAEGRLFEEDLVAFFTTPDTYAPSCLPSCVSVLMFVHRSDDARSTLSTARSVRSEASRQSTSRGNPVTGEGMTAASPTAGRKHITQAVRRAYNPITGE